jgi:hypothetical protein
MHYVNSSGLVSNNQGTAYTINGGYKLKLYDFTVSNPSPQRLLNAEFPIVEDYFWQDNNAGPVTAWLDNNEDTNFVPGYAMFNSPHMIVCKFPERWNPVVKKVIVRDKYGPAGFTPTKFYLVNKNDNSLVEIGQYDGSLFGQDIVMNVASPFPTDRLIVKGFADNNGHLGGGDFYGAGLRIIGDYDNVPEPTYSRPKVELGRQFGSNGFVWDVMKNDVAYNTTTVYLPKFNRLLEMGLTSLRFYMEEKYLQPTENEWSYEPSTQDFYYDSLFQICKDNGIVPLPTILNNPSHMFNNSTDPNFWEHTNPIIQADANNKTSVTVYKNRARVGFVFAGRYGRNTSIPDSLFGTQHQFSEFWIPAGVIKKGLNTLNYIELGNEEDKNWATKDHYMSGYQMAPYLSAVYDGHKGTLDAGFGAGVGVGIKTADPTMKVVIPGFGVAIVDVLKGIYDWSKENRGYIDGVVDVPFDVINYHKYSTNGGSSQYGEATTAMPLELSGDLNVLKKFISYSNEFAQGKEVWLSEWGFDYHEYSVFGVPEINGRSKKEVVAIWGIRSILLFSMNGIDRSYWFKIYNNYQGDGSSTYVQFDTMSLLNDEYAESGGLTYPNPPGVNTNPTYERRPIGDYLSQLKQYRDYKPDADLSIGNIKVLRFKKDTGETIYAIWRVEDTFPNTSTKYFQFVVQNVATVGFTEVTGIYDLALPTGTNIRIKTFQLGSTVMNSQDATVTGTSYPVVYGMTPKIIEIL